jgi:hypothetical protein
MPGADEEANEIVDAGNVWHGEVVVPQLLDFGQPPRKLRLLPGARKSKNRGLRSVWPGKGPFELD